jgi:hypothetical protein
MPLPTDRFRGSVPIRSPQQAPVDRSGEIIGSAVEKFATDMTNLAISKAKDHANAQGDLTNIDPTSFYGAAFLNKSSEVFSQSVRNDARKEADVIAAENPNDVAQYDARFAAYRDTVLEGVPEELMPQTILDIDAIHASKRSGVLAAQAQFAANALVDEHNADQEGIAQQITDHIQSGADDPLMADYLVGQYNANNRRMVEAKMMTPAEAASAEQGLVRTMDVEIATTAVRARLIENDVMGASAIMKEIQFDDTLDEKTQTRMMNAGMAEINAWATRDNRMKARDKAALTKRQNEAMIADTRAVVEGEVKTSGEYLNLVEDGTLSRSYGLGMARAAHDAEEKAIAAANAAVVENARAVFDTGLVKNIHPDVVSLMTPTQKKSYQGALAKRTKGQSDATKAMDATDIELFVTMNPGQVDRVQLAADTRAMVEDGTLTEGQYASINKAHLAASVKAANGQQMLTSAAVKLDNKQQLSVPEMNAMEKADPEAYRPTDPSRHPFVVGASHAARRMQPSAAEFLKSASAQSDENLVAAFGLFNMFEQSPQGVSLSEEALGGKYAQMRAGSLHYASTGDVQGSRKVMVDMQAADSKAASRKLSEHVDGDESESERLEFYGDAGMSVIQENAGWFDTVLGWAGVNFDPNIDERVSTFADRDINIADIPITGEFLHYLADGADTMLQQENPIVNTRQEAAEIMTYRGLKIFSPVQLEDGEWDWRRTDVNMVEQGQLPEWMRENWSRKIPMQDVRIRLLSHGIVSPTGQSWDDTMIDLRVVRGTEGADSPTYSVMYKDGLQWHPFTVQVDGKSPAPVHYKWEYETSGWKIAHDIHVNAGTEGNFFEASRAYLRGDNPSFWGLIDGGPQQEVERLIATSDREAHERRWRDNVNAITPPGIPPIGNFLYSPEEKRQQVNDDVAISGKPLKAPTDIFDPNGGVLLNILKSR